MSVAQLFQTAFEAHQTGELEAAKRRYEALLALEPNHFDALHMLGVLKMQQSDFATAATLIERALQQHDGYALAWQNLATAYKGLKRPGDAANCLDKRLSLLGRAAELDLPMLDALAELNLEASRPAEAARRWRQVLAQDANNLGALTGLGLTQQAMGETSAALAVFDQVLARAPVDLRAGLSRAVLLCSMRRHHEALAQLDALLVHHTLPAPAVHNARALVLWKLERLNEARSAYDLAISQAPNYAEALCNRGALSAQLGQENAAMQDYRRALELEPLRAETLNCIGALLAHQYRYDEAIASYLKALHQQPQNAQIHNNLGACLTEAGQLSLAIEHFSEAITLMQAEHAKRVEATDTAAGLADTLSNRSGLWARLRDFKKAAADAAAAVALNPEQPYTYGNLFYFELMQCDWSNFSTRLHELNMGLGEVRPVATPFVALAAGLSASQQKACASRYAAARFPPSQAVALPGPTVATGDERVRLAMVSSDFHDHATAHLIAGLFEQLDKGRFELIAVSYGPKTDDPYQQRLRQACSTFVDVQGMSESRTCALIRSLDTHIAVDLKGYTLGARPGIFSERCAPVQVSFLGYPGTTGMPGIDYVLADAVTLPPSLEADFTESIVRLPYSYQCNDKQRAIASHHYDRGDFGLPKSGFVFCCFNNSYKITPTVFDVWMRLLKQVDGSVLWLLEDNPVVAKNLRREARKRGVDSGRLVFAARLPTDEHLARQRLADLFLDTWPVNAHTTAADALWAGLPLLTLQDEAFAGRVAASLLHAMGRANCVATDAVQYESEALSLAREPQRLLALRRALSDDKYTAPLFDTKLFTRHFETALLMMKKRWQAGLLPSSFDVPA
jgi:protein O-GlcNAc transferase